KNRSSKFCYRRRDCLPMWFSIGARLVIASDGKNREVDSQPDENCAKSNADHAEPTEKKLPQSESKQAREEKAKGRAQQRKPLAKTCKEDCPDQQNGAKQRGKDVVMHVAGNFGCKDRASGQG